VFFNAAYALSQRPFTLQLNAEMVSSQSYNTDQAQGRYLYLGRGIATQFNDYVFGEIRTQLFLDGKLARSASKPLSRRFIARRTGY
jgi:hypothetical protein